MTPWKSPRQQGSFVLHSTLAVLLLLFQLDVLVADGLSLTPDRFASEAIAAPGGLGVDAQVGEHVVGSQDIAIFHLWHEDGG